MRMRMRMGTKQRLNMQYRLCKNLWRRKYILENMIHYCIIMYIFLVLYTIQERKMHTRQESKYDLYYTKIEIKSYHIFNQFYCYHIKEIWLTMWQSCKFQLLSSNSFPNSKNLWHSGLWIQLDKENLYVFVYGITK